MNNRKYKINKNELLKIMIDKGYKRISDLSRATGINRCTLYKMMNKDSYPSIPIIFRLISFLEIPSERAGEIFFNSDLHIKWKTIRIKIKKRTWMPSGSKFKKQK